MTCTTGFKRITQFCEINVTRITVNGVELTPGGGGGFPVSGSGVFNGESAEFVTPNFLVYSDTSGYGVQLGAFSGGPTDNSIYLEVFGGTADKSIYITDVGINITMGAYTVTVNESGISFSDGSQVLNPAQVAAIAALTGSSTAADIVAALQAT
jgi:hypothetical protein